MAAKKKTDFTKMSVEDLNNRLSEVRDELSSAKLKFRLGQFKKTSEFSRLRKEVAQIKTITTKLNAEASK